MQRPGACFVPEQENVHPIDLDRKNALEHVASVARAAGGADVLIGGPPCQGFSSANRNSWSSDNPNNRLVDVFMRYVDKLRPAPPPILWTTDRSF
jgi:site-specific DNA-cytosine methylase